MYESGLMRMVSWTKRIGIVAAALLFINLIGCVIYLVGARHAWVIPEEAANGRPRKIESVN